MKVFQQLICVLLGFFYGQAIVSTVICAFLGFFKGKIHFLMGNKVGSLQLFSELYFNYK